MQPPQGPIQKIVIEEPLTLPSLSRRAAGLSLDKGDSPTRRSFRRRKGGERSGVIGKKRPCVIGLQMILRLPGKFARGSDWQGSEEYRQKKKREKKELMTTRVNSLSPHLLTLMSYSSGIKTLQVPKAADNVSDKLPYYHAPLGATQCKCHSRGSKKKKKAGIRERKKAQAGGRTPNLLSPCLPSLPFFPFLFLNRRNTPLCYVYHTAGDVRVLGRYEIRPSRCLFRLSTDTSAAPSYPPPSCTNGSFASYR